MLKMSRAELAAASGVAEKPSTELPRKADVSPRRHLQKIQEALERGGIIFHNGKPTAFPGTPTAPSSHPTRRLSDDRHAPIPYNGRMGLPPSHSSP